MRSLSAADSWLKLLFENKSIKAKRTLKVWWVDKGNKLSGPISIEASKLPLSRPIKKNYLHVMVIIYHSLASITCFG